MCFGLFTKIGGARAATLTLLGGLTSYAVASWVAMPYPFITSLACSMTCYLAGGFRERA
jgi:hypothetical protein